MNTGKMKDEINDLAGAARRKASDLAGAESNEIQSLEEDARDKGHHAFGAVRGKVEDLKHRVSK